MATLGLQAQDIIPEDAPIRRDWNSIIPTATLRADYLLKSGSYAYFESNYNFNKEYFYLTHNYRLYGQAGYEHAFTDHWYFGGSAKYQWSYSGPNSAVAKANITHRGKIGSFGFIKEISGEYIHLFSNLSTNSINARGSIAAGLYKDFQVLKRPLIASVFYRLYINTILNDVIYKYRKFDFSKGRLDLAYGIHENLYIGIYGMLDTEYYFTLGIFDEFGNALYPNYRRNRINPIVGLSINLLFRQDKNDKTFLPGLPFR
jgi:hypothetical protein